MTNEADSSSGHHAREEEKERSYKNSRLYGQGGLGSEAVLRFADDTVIFDPD